MSKAFDTISCKITTRRSKRYTKPRQTPHDVHPHKGYKTKGQSWQNIGEEIKTEIGITQGDCHSAELFIYFLAKSINPTPPDTDHSYACTRQPILPVEHFDHYKKI